METQTESIEKSSAESDINALKAENENLNCMVAKYQKALEHALYNVDLSRENKTRLRCDAIINAIK